MNEKENTILNATETVGVLFGDTLRVGCTKIGRLKKS